MQPSPKEREWNKRTAKIPVGRSDEENAQPDTLPQEPSQGKFIFIFSLVELFYILFLCIGEPQSSQLLERKKKTAKSPVGRSDKENAQLDTLPPEPSQGNFCFYH